MTNQEAQTALANLKRYMSGGGAVDRVTNKAIDMAIEALKQPEPCDDAVSREAVKNAICDYVCAPDVRCVSNHECRMKHLISELPPVLPKKRTEEHKWETCFDCPLSHGCPKIKGCTNEQAIEYASQIPNDCPLSAQPEPCEDAVSRDSANYYSERLKNDEHKAVEILDVFTKAFCIDAEAGNDLVFRCPECLFQTIDGTCLVKAFKHKFDPDYKDFGSMGDL